MACGKIILAGGSENCYGRWENYFGRCENYFGRWVCAPLPTPLLGKLVSQVGKLFWQEEKLFWQVGKDSRLSAQSEFMNNGI